jgi:deoxyribonuclease V
VTIGFLDVHYEGGSGRAACVVADAWEAETPSSTYVAVIDSVEPYEPGRFFRRELPCLVSVLRLVPVLPAVVVVDGYTWLASLDRPGLGAHLYEALGRATPVVGIAKTAFAGVDRCADVVQVVRGTSRKPLFVTAIGMDPAVAGQCVRRMAGKHRIPELVRLVDRLARGAGAENR